MFILIFYLLRCSGKKNTWMRMILVTVMVKCHSESCLISAIFKVLNNYKAQLTAVFQRHLSVENFIWTCINICVCFSWVNIMKRKWAKVPWKLLPAQKSEPVLWETLHQDISLIILFFFYTEINLVFKFNLMLIK